MTKAKAWMPIYIGDYLGDTQRLTTEQHGAYLLLIFDYWRSGPPPDDDEVLQQITLLDRPRWKKHRPVIARFFEIENGLWVHKRIERERVNALDNQDRRSAKAQAAARARWHTPSNADGMPDAMLGASPPPSPSPSNDKPLEKSVSRASKLPADFEPLLTEHANELWHQLDDPMRELAKFKDHHTAKGSTYKDWQAAFRTWLSNAIDYQRRNTNGRDRSGWSRALGR